MIGFGRRNFLVPMPRFESFEALNAWLEAQCLKRQDEVLIHLFAKDCRILGQENSEP